MKVAKYKQRLLSSSFSFRRRVFHLSCSSYSTMGGDHKCPVCQATFTRPQHVARHMRSRTYLLFISAIRSLGALHSERLQQYAPPNIMFWALLLYSRDNLNIQRLLISTQTREIALINVSIAVTNLHGGECCIGGYPVSFSRRGSLPPLVIYWHDM